MQTLEKRFWAKVDRRGPDECWPWTGALNNGYGVIGAGGKGGATLRAHRVSYVLAHGHLRAEVKVLHSCDNPPCCNPAHLVAGTIKRNATEMRDRRRSHGWKLSAEDVETIRSSSQSQGELAQRFGVDQSQISRVLNHRSWG